MTVMKSLVILLMAQSLILLPGCALLSSGQQPPEVRLSNVEPAARQGLEQNFMISLRILNPNSTQLNISGLSYSLKLEGHKLVSGVAGELHPIPPYGQVAIKVPASTNLISGLKIIGAFMEKNEQSVDFQLETRIHRGWWRMPITVVESGSLNLTR
ncbi:LEA type 2 family protein [Porticoccus sp.]|uniref:LEA type 2 family protein n=1 Tax=Porticoccus sp. TaxID=2024853 RepID=UPI003F69DBB6